MKLVWEVVEAINNTPELDIIYPTCKRRQLEIARGFKYLSAASFDNCAGCVDGLLIWIQKPNQTTVQETKVGQTKYFCGRKNKYGLNLQGTCDHKRRFIDIDIRHPAATSDYLAFQTSALNKKLEQDGFLHDKLAIYGDCAYVNSPYMATPFKGVSGGDKDSYNFYHSQV
jgi:hypothetical protein